MNLKLKVLFTFLSVVVSIFQFFAIELISGGLPIEGKIGISSLCYSFVLVSSVVIWKEPFFSFGLAILGILALTFFTIKFLSMNAVNSTIFVGAMSTLNLMILGLFIKNIKKTKLK